MGPVVALLEEVPDPLLAALRAELPNESTVVPVDKTSVELEAEFLVAWRGQVSEALLAQLPNLKCVVSVAQDRRAVDEVQCAKRGIVVVRVPSLSLITVAEHALMFMLMLFKRVEKASAALRSGVVEGDAKPEITTQDSYAYNWVGLRDFASLRGRRVGLVGLGRIGGEVARLLGCFGATVAYTKPRRASRDEERALGVDYVTFPELLATSDLVSLHNRFTPETEQLMGAKEFGSMRRGAYFVNTARGRLVDESALVGALGSGQLGGAALDVFWREPLPLNSPLLAAPNLLLTPHSAGIPTAESELTEFREAGQEIRKLAL